MDREIKFRGKRLDNGEWLEGGIYQIDARIFIIEDPWVEDDECVFDWLEVDPATVVIIIVKPCDACADNNYEKGKNNNT